MSALHIHLLGDFLLLAEDTPVTTITIPRLQSLLAYLLLHRDAPQDRSHLAFLLWPDSTEAQAHTNLRKLLYQLRKSLPEIDQFLYTDKQSVQWRPASPAISWTLDILELEQELAQAEQAKQLQDTTAQREALESVAHVYRGDLLPTCYDEWILPERDRWRQLFLLAAERLITLLEQERDYDAAIPVAQHLLRQDPLHESTYRQLMRLHALRGDRAAALRAYHTCATVMERELGTEPGEITRTDYETLLQSDAAPRTQTGSLAARGTAPPLLGRKAQWQHLQEAWRKAVRGHAHVVLLTGEAGIGKTRLAEEMEAWVSRQGMTTAKARCYAAVGHLAYAPVTTWLRADTLQTGIADLDPTWHTEIARLLPEVLVKRPKLPRPVPMTEGWQRQQFFEALARAVCSARQPLLLLLDDMQWCDNETLEWLHYLLRFAPEARLLLIGTVRAEEMRPDHPLAVLLGALQRDSLVTEIALEPLTTMEATSLAEHIMGQRLDETTRNTLYHETEGNPLFVVEMARAGTVAQSGKTSSTARSLLTPAASTLPPSVQSVIATRLSQLSPLACEVANIAAVIGRGFPFSVLAQVHGKGEDAVVQGLDELWQRRIVREQGVGMTDTYDFSHDKLREQIYTSLSPTHRRLLHRRVAEACKVVYVEDLESVSGQIAAHYEHAGLPEQAIPYYKRAGEVAMHIYANAEAITAFEHARTLLTTNQVGTVWKEKQWETVTRLYEHLGDVYVEVGGYPEARQAYEHALPSIPAQAYIQRACIYRKIGRAWNYVSTNPHDAFHSNAREAFQEAEHLLMLRTDPEDPIWRNEWIDLHFTQVWPLRGTVDEMAATLGKVHPIIEQYGTQEQRKMLARTGNMHKAMRNRYVVTEEAISVCRAMLSEALQTEDKGQIAARYMALGIMLMLIDQLDEAEEKLGTALSMGEQMGIVWLQTRCLTFFPFVYRKRGQVEQVRDMLDRAQAIGAAQNNSVLAGHRAWAAWREGNLAEAETYGRQSVEQRQDQPMEFNPFQWAGRWPLVGVALAQQRMAMAMDNVRLLLDPTQNPLPKQLSEPLETALRAWDAGQSEEARELLQRSVPLAEQLGYL